MKLKHLSYLLLTVLLSATSIGVHSQTVNKDFFDGEIYVKYNDDFAVDFSKQFVEPQLLVGLNEELVKEFGITQARFSFNKIPDIKLQRTVRIKFSAMDKVEGLIKHFKQLPYIEYAEKIYVTPKPYIPNDLGLNTYSDSWHLYNISSLKAWDISKGDSAIVIAVVDDEVDINHEDLRNNIWKNPNEIPNNGIDDDGNGYIDDIHGWDVSDNDNNVTGYNSIFHDHGTRSAGVISATTDNNIGISGVGFNVSILSVKISSDFSSSNGHTHIYEGLAYAAIANPDIINCSCGGTHNTQTGKNTVDFIINKNIPLIASAHNYNNTIPIYPAAYSGVLSVGATDKNDKKASFSNYGSWVNISAPGVNFKSLRTGNRYAGYGGTSASAPVVSGVAGLMKSYMPTISKSDLELCLISSADNIENLNPSYKGQLGSGRINAEKALLCVDSVKKSPPSINIITTKNYICPLEKITLTANSYKRPLDSAVWYIYKKNGIEIKKGIQVETSFQDDSIYSVTVVGYDKFGKDSINNDQLIHVNTLYNHIFYFENFENEESKFEIINPDNGSSWYLSPAQKATFNRAIKMDFFNSKIFHQRDAFITPEIDLSKAIKPYLTFHYAYGSNSYTDSLNIFVSTDSGKTFPVKIFSTQLGQIVTTKFSNNKPFFPNATNQWCVLNTNKCPTISLNSLAGKKNVTLKFEAYYGGGNNLYLDDIRVYANCGDVINKVPISSFTSVDSSACLDDTLQFSATSTSFPETYQWILEGATPDTTYGLNPKAKYLKTGNYDVTLITSNVLGSDTVIKKNYIKVVAPPKIAVSNTQQYVCPKDSVFFTAWGTDSIVWKNINTNKIIIDSILGDRPVQNTFYQAKAINKEGCFDTATVKAIMVPLPPSVSLNQKIDSVEAVHTIGNFTYLWYINDTLTNLYTTKAIKPYKTANYKVEIIDSAGCSSISSNLSISTVGINELANNTLKIYPNPTSKNLFISGLLAKESEITITDILGKQVYSSAVNKTSVIINVASFDKGLYLITVKQKGTATIRKVVVE